MEHQSCVGVGPDFKEELILHETAHEWWGNSVSCTDLADIWIHEAFATYAVYLFLEANRGKTEAAAYLDYLGKNIKGEFPLVGTYGVNHIHYNFNDVYSKGALLLHTVRILINDDAVWFGILKGLQQDYKYKSITTPELIKYINRKAKKDFTYLFEQYLYSPEAPLLELQVKELKNNLQVTYRWQNSRKNFAMPVKVTESENVYKVIYPTNSWQTTEFANLDADTFNVESNKLFKIAKVKVK
jgi:aminopeptidase N